MLAKGPSTYDPLENKIGRFETSPQTSRLYMVCSERESQYRGQAREANAQDCLGDACVLCALAGA
jgi:hypothetical protein